MVTIKCTAPTTISLNTLTPFQGDLKKRNPNDIKALAESIRDEGLLMPFAVWKHDDKNYLLDGHGRLAALTELMLVDTEIATQQFPCIVITASDEQEAKKALLQITSQYGKITKQGAAKFCASIPTYHAPSINKFVHTTPKRRKNDTTPTETVLKIAVASEKVEEVKKIFSEVSYIRFIG